MVLSQSPPISATELLLAAVIFCLLFWVVRASRSQVPKGLKSPPGPWGWPLIGHVLTLGKNPHLALAKLSQKYGDVMQIRIGTTPVVVLSGLDTIRQALVRQGDDFKGRPDLYSFTLVTDGQSLTFNPDSGPVWAARKRLAQDALKSFSIASDPASASSCYLEEHVSKEAECLIGRVQELMAEVGHFDPYNQVVISVAKVIGAMCFGKHFPHNSEEMLSIVTNTHEFVETASSGNPVDFFPILRYLPNPALERFKEFNKRFLYFLQKTVQEHYQDFDRNSVQDIVGALFKHSEKASRANGGLIPQEKIVNLINDIFGAGFDTVTTAISWSLMYLVTKPEIQKKIQKDTTRNTTLNGFHIPKERCVFINQWQVNHDPKTWEDPSEFRPERFLTDNNRAINKTLSEKVMLFGLGKRKCIGEIPAKWEIFLFLTSLLQQLEFSVPPGTEVDLTPIYGLTMKHARCDQVRAQPRFSK
ncbi:cytochrome P450 1A2 isoform X2 [Sciurus carolinensis]|uniref:cytochrome P450 1A2 isoform X2 n=1 Tax=Sciurus carolinensis TaxID=30640 RepID=UPI001FB21E4B|nr:cytochrome P450 1A2 isoform X2 [Sciurus carolinensis]